MTKKPFFKPLVFILLCIALVSMLFGISNLYKMSSDADHQTTWHTFYSLEKFPGEIYSHKDSQLDKESYVDIKLKKLDEFNENAVAVYEIFSHKLHNNEHGYVRITFYERAPDNENLPFRNYRYLERINIPDLEKDISFMTYNKKYTRLKDGKFEIPCSLNVGYSLLMIVLCIIFFFLFIGLTAQLFSSIKLFSKPETSS